LAAERQKVGSAEMELKVDIAKGMRSKEGRLKIGVIHDG
jgi:hypothetical protein